MMMPLIVILLFPWIRVYANQCRKSSSQTNLKLQGHMIKSLSRSGSLQCVDECASHGKCHSINFYQDKRICELNDANHLSNPESLVYSHGSQYLNYFKRPVAKCSSKNCKKPRTCVMLDDGLNYKCELVVSEVLNFPRKSIKDKVVLETPFNSLAAFTVALWVQADPRTSQHTAFSYATTNNSNEILFYATNTNQTIFCLGICYIISNITVVDGKWHHLCMTWESLQGKLKVYINGLLMAEKVTRTGKAIGKGAIVLGQDQDSYKGGFDTYKSLQGNLTSVNMWDKVFTAQTISDLTESCAVEEGNIVKWSDLKDKGEGDVKLIRTSECAMKQEHFDIDHQEIQNDDAQDSNSMFTINLGYCFSWRAAIKTWEILVLIIAMSCMVQYDAFWTRYPANLIVYYMVVCLSWIMQLIFFILMLCSLEHRRPLYHWDLCGVFASVAEVVFLAAVSGLMGNDALLHRKLEWKDDNLTDEIRHHYHSLIAAVGLTLVAALTFVIDAVLHAVLFFKRRRRRNAE